jgi:hypothetical protein
MVGDFTNYRGEETSLFDVGLKAVDVVLNGPLVLTLGTCDEYNNYTTYRMPVPFMEHSKEPIFEEVYGAGWCADASAALGWWIDVLIVILFLSFLIYLRWRVRHVAIEEDKSMWTTGDYAVCLRNLTDGLDESQSESLRMTADKLRDLVFEDLDAMGFPRSCIKQVEVGRKCAREMKFMGQLEKANIRRHELEARKQYAQERKRRGGKNVKVEPGIIGSTIGAATSVTRKVADTAVGSAKKLAEGVTDVAEGVAGGLSEVGNATGVNKVAGAVAGGLSEVSERTGVSKVAGAAAGGLSDLTEKTRALAEESVNAAAGAVGDVTSATERMSLGLGDKLGVTMDETDEGLEEEALELNEDLQKIMKELEVLYDEPDYATGQAFVVFNYEKDKIRLLKKFNSAKGGKVSGLFFQRRVAPADGIPSLRRSAAGRRVQCIPAPEPSEVNWCALEIDDAAQARNSLRTWVTIVLMLIASAALIITVKVLKQIQTEDPFVEGSTGSIVLYVLMAASSLCTAVTNFVLKISIVKLTHLEGRDTKTEHEASLFKKLSLAYVVNSAFIPIFVGFFFSFNGSGVLVDQSWYEKSGVVGQAWLLLIISAFAKDVPKVIPVPVIIKRRFKVARSQAKLNQLWKPPTLYIGDLYANTLKTISLSLVYGPLYPLTYLWGIFALIFCNLCTTYGISRWYGKPPAVDEEMMMALRTVLSGLLIFQIFISGCAAESLGVAFDSPHVPYAANVAVYILAPLLWLVYALMPLGLFKMFRSVEEEEEMGEGDNDGDGQEGDTGGVHFDDVAKLKGYEMEPYICPKITERIYRATKKAQEQAAVTP